jgi:hypothetical protein
MANSLPAVDTLQVDGEPSTEPKKRTRRCYGRSEPPDREPEVIEGEEFGKAFVRVELFGRIAEQELPKEHRFMTLDAEDWPRVSATSLWWCINSGGGGFFIGRGKANLAGLAKQSKDSHPNLGLSRLIVGAGPGQIVMRSPGNPLDLRKANLYRAEDRVEEREARAGVKLFKDHLDCKGF